MVWWRACLKPTGPDKKFRPEGYVQSATLYLLLHQTLPPFAVVEAAGKVTIAMRNFGERHIAPHVRKYANHQQKRI
jgi:hypothetical protein